MGTRHFQKVINKKGEIKLAQYGQWDGYPSGQGIDILEYLRNGNLEQYQINLDNIPLITDEQNNKIEKQKDWDKKYPYLSRDCGSRIHKMIEENLVLFVAHIDEKEAKQWCEGFYTIDFKKNVFISEFGNIKKSYKLNKLPSKEKYLKDFKTNQD
jgi:hypothetical protein